MLPVDSAGVADVIGHASLIVTRRALEALEARVGEVSSTAEAEEAAEMDSRQVIIEPVVSEKSYALMADGKYTFRVDDRAHKTQIRTGGRGDLRRRRGRGADDQGALEAEAPRPAQRQHPVAGRRRSSQLAPGDRIELFEGAAVAE